MELEVARMVVEAAIGRVTRPEVAERGELRLGDPVIRLRAADLELVREALDVTSAAPPPDDIAGGFRVWSYVEDEGAEPLVVAGLPTEEEAELLAVVAAEKWIDPEVQARNAIEWQRRAEALSEANLSGAARAAFYEVLRAEGFEPGEIIPIRGDSRRKGDWSERAPVERCGTLAGRVVADNRSSAETVLHLVARRAEEHARMLVAHLREVGAVNLAELTPCTVLTLALHPRDLVDGVRRYDVFWDGCGVGPSGRLLQAPKGRKSAPFVDDTDTDTNTPASEFVDAPEEVVTNRMHGAPLEGA